MAGIKGLLARVRRLEPKPSLVARRLGSLEEFVAEAQAGITAGRYDPRDMPDVVLCLRRWVEQGL